MAPMRVTALRHSALGFGPLVSRPLDPDMTRRFVAPLADPGVRRDAADVHGARSTRPTCSTCRPGSAAFDRPVRLVWGDADRFFRLDFAHRLAERLPARDAARRVRRAHLPPARRTRHRRHRDRRRHRRAEQADEPVSPGVRRTVARVSRQDVTRSHEHVEVRSMKIADILRHKHTPPDAPVVTIGPDETVTALLAALAEHNVGALVVVDGEQRRRHRLRARRRAPARRTRRRAARRAGLGDHDQRGPQLHERRLRRRHRRDDDRVAASGTCRSSTTGGSPASSRSATSCPAASASSSTTAASWSSTSAAEPRRPARAVPATGSSSPAGGRWVRGNADVQAPTAPAATPPSRYLP